VNTLAAQAIAPVRSVQEGVARNGRRMINALRLAGGLDRPQAGCSPYTVVWSKDKVTLRHYTSGPEGRPVLLVPSLINRSHIWDIRPGDSFVEGLQAHGYDVFLVDWGVPDARDARNSMTTYVDDYLPAAVAAVRESAGESPVVLGHCFGGVISVLWAASTPEPPPALICLGVPTNWLEMGPLAQMTRQGRLDPEDLLDDSGNVPPTTLLRSFQMLRPLGDLAGYVTLWTRLHERRAAQAIWALTDWAHDHVPFPGAAFVDMIRRLSRENGLATGSVTLGGRDRKLCDITIPFLNIYGTYDHVTPPPSVTPLGDLVGSDDSETRPLKAGHIGLLVGSSARKQTLPLISTWLEERGLASGS
jgi:poly[(R)-3-hydroxyalkanoate] polymerase subunit PhaC